MGLFWLIVFFVIWLIYKKSKHSQNNATETLRWNKSAIKHAEKSYVRDVTRVFKPSELHGHRCFIDDLTNYEYRLVKALSGHLNPKEYYLFNNVTIPSSTTGTTQIDHIIASKYGIFVIENKDYSGWIFGNKNGKTWTQMLRRKKFHFQNPIFQNFAHVSALKEQMPFLKKSFYSVVVFSEDSEFKTDMPVNVMHGEDLIDYVQSKKDEIVSEGELLMAIGKLSVLCQTVQVSNEDHIKNLNLVHSKSALKSIPLSSSVSIKI